MRTISNWQDILIPANYVARYDNVYLSKVRNFIFLLLCFFIASLVLGLYEIGRNHFLIVGSLLGAPFCAALAYSIFRKTSRIELSANIVVGYAAFIDTIDSLILGYLNAPGVVWFGTVAIGSISTIGVRNSSFWAGYFIVLSIVDFFLQVNGYPIHYQIGEHELALIKLLCNIGSIATVSGLIIKYEIERQKLYKEVHEKSDEVMNLIRVLTHDLANPLAVIHTSNQLLPKGVHPMVDKTKDRTARSIKNMINIIDHVREARAVYDGKKEINFDFMDLNATIKNCADMFEDKLKNKSLTFDLKLSEEPASVYVDQKAIETSVINNLISNAIKFSEPNSNIEMSTVVTDQYVLFRIRDYGIGMPQEILENLFNPTSSTSREGTQGEPGTGFGMPILKAYLDKFKAQIKVNSYTIEDSKHKRGTEFVIQFPREKTEVKTAS